LSRRTLPLRRRHGLDLVHNRQASLAAKLLPETASGTLPTPNVRDKLPVAKLRLCWNRQDHADSSVVSWSDRNVLRSHVRVIALDRELSSTACEELVLCINRITDCLRCARDNRNVVLTAQSRRVEV